jgi:hypothetical protein
MAAAAILAELYGEYGVLQKTIELLDNKPLQGLPGTQDAMAEAYSQIGFYGLVFGIARGDTTTNTPAADVVP